MIRHYVQHIVLLLLVMSEVPCVFAQQKMERLFYYVNRESSFASFTEHVEQISIVAPVAYNVDEDGVVWGGVDPRVLRIAKEHDIDVMPLIHNPGFHQDMLHDLLSSDIARRRAIESILDECNMYGYSGMQFDFENLSMNDKELFTRFYQEAANALHQGDFMISVAVVHRPAKFPGPTKYFKWLYKNWRAGYDLKALSDIGDFISVMAYSQHTRRTTPGPNAGVPWVKQNLAYFLKSVPPEKLSLGIPVVSQHWRTEQDDEQYLANARSWSKSLSYREAVSLAERYNARIQWLDDQQVPYTFFENGGLFEYVFFEDAKSFQAKLDLVNSYKLRGISVWVIGREDEAIWHSLPEKE